MAQRISICVSIFVVTTLFFGCGDRVRYLEVSGSITLEGKPIDVGVIRFIPVESGPTVREGGGQITDGRYKATACAGENRVYVMGSRKTGVMYKPEPEMYPDLVEERIEMITDEKLHWGEGVLVTIPKNGAVPDIDLPPSPNKGKRK